MATYTKVKLSGHYSDNQMIVWDGTAVGHVAHTTGTSSSVLDEVWLWVITDSSTTYIQGRWGVGASQVTIPVPSSSVVLLIPGAVISGNGSTAATVELNSSDGTAIGVYGYVNRITP